MRLVAVICLLFAFSPAIARADCSSIPECLLRLNTPRLDPKIIAIVGAGAAAVVAAGALVAATRFQLERPMPSGVITSYDPLGRTHFELPLVPSAPPVATAPPPRLFGHETPPPSGVFRFNDLATNIVLVAGGAAILGSIIASFAKHH
jgi:hypothetical protein